MISFALVDAFTDRPFAGNTAGVVSDADGLSSDQMQRIARELGQTETCFVSSSRRARGRSGAALVHAHRRGRPLRSCHRCGLHCPRRRRACRLERRSRSTLLRNPHRHHWGLARTDAVRFATGHDVGRCRVACTRAGGPVGRRTGRRAGAISDRRLAAPDVGPRQRPPDRSRVATQRFASLGAEWTGNGGVRQADWLPALHARLSRDGKPRWLRPPASLRTRQWHPGGPGHGHRSRGSRDLPRPGRIVATWRASCIDWRAGARNRSQGQCHGRGAAASWPHH